ITKGEADCVQQLEELKALTERRQEVRTILSEAAVQSLEEQYFWISTDWLRLWADIILPPKIEDRPRDPAKWGMRFEMWSRRYPFLLLPMEMF
ncbi:hypothetical protein AALP_AAs61001U000100, partial [Arabis alpina]